jgi:hypothetical protein
MTIRVEVNYRPRLSPSEKLLLALGDRVKNLRPLMTGEIAPAANRMLLRWWESNGNGTWAPLAPSTIKAKIRKGTFGRGTLRDTLHLFRTLFQERTADSRLRTVSGGLRLQLNTGVPYAIYHQVGTSRMPQRQVIPDPLPQSFTRECRALIRAYLLKRA